MAFNLKDLQQLMIISKEIIDNIYFSLRKLDITEVKEYIKSIWPRKNELNSLTHLTKIVCVIDLIENKKEH